MLELAAVRQVQGRRTVLAIDALALAPGERLAVVGPNGSGKSTLLRLLACLEAPTAGEVRLDGRTVRGAAGRREARARITLVEQRPFLFQGTVLANAAWGLRARGVPRGDAEARAKGALQRLECSALTDRDARALSEGEIQRVAVARALACAPDVLLLDEPVSGADRAAQHALAHAIRLAQAERPLAVCVASHQLEEAYAWADRILALHDGVAVPVTPENLFRVELPGDGPMQSVRVHGTTVDLVSDRRGHATIAIPAEEVVLSRAPLHSSARNSLAGRIIRISEQAGAMRLTIDAGLPLVALVTRRSYDELDLGIGQHVVASFKSVAVRVF